MNKDNLFFSKKLLEAYIPLSISNIGAYSFYSNSELRTVIIPANIRSIGAHAFDKCSSLEDVKFADNSIAEIYKIWDWAFSGTAIKHLLLPSSVYDIGVGAFAYNTSLRDVSFYNDSRLSVICDNAFINCDGLYTITLPKGLTSIADTAFIGCDRLQAITCKFPQSATVNKNAPWGAKNAIILYE